MDDELPFNVITTTPLVVECEACGQALANRLFRWEHTEPADHEPVPVTRMES